MSVCVVVTVVCLKTEIIGSYSAASDPNKSAKTGPEALCFSLVFVCVCVFLMLVI